MAIDVDFSGGESVYCINQSQLKQAHVLATQNPESAPKIRAALSELRTELTRNERAAVAFVLIEELLKAAGTDISKEAAPSADSSPLGSLSQLTSS